MTVEAEQPGLFDLTEEQAQRVLCVAFAALVNAYGKPLVIPDAWVDALPANFTLYIEPVENGQQLTVRPDEH